MITKLKIKNFRGIKNLELDLKKTSIISGQNNSFKTTAIVALNWLLTGKAVNFDNPGQGENDSMNILSANVQRGDKLSVEITVEYNGITKNFEKCQTPVWNDEGTKITKNNPSYRINGVVVKTLKEFELELEEAFNFKSHFKGIDEKRLWTDPQYALMKLDFKDLRQMLVGIGCNVTNKELYERGFHELEAYEKQYSGDFTKFRKKLKQDLQICENERMYAEKKCNECSSFPDEFNATILNQLNEAKEEYLLSRSRLKLGSASEEISNLELAIKEKQLERSRLVMEHNQELDNKISTCKMQIEIEKARLLALKEQSTRTLNHDLELAKEDLEHAKKNLELYTETRTNLVNEFTAANKKLKDSIKERTDAAVLLEATKNETFSGVVSCPNCSMVFATDPTAEKLFIDTKESKIQRLNEAISASKKLQTELETKKNEINIQGQNLKIEIEKARQLVLETQKKVDELTFKLNEIPEPDNSDLLNLHNELNALIQEKNTTWRPVEISNEIRNLEMRRDDIRMNSENANYQAISELNLEIEKCDTMIQEQLTIRSQVATKKQRLNEYKDKIAAKNETEFLLSKVNKFIQTMISMINKKALEKTGIQFVMLEENLTNASLQEVCYAVDENGVPYSTINSSRKVQIGCDFLNKIKTILLNEYGVQMNTYPIITDALEKVDFIEKIENLTDEQLICTRVSTNEQITIL